MNPAAGRGPPIARRSGRAASAPLGWPRGLQCMVLLGRCTKYRRPPQLSTTATPRPSTSAQLTKRALVRRRVLCSVRCHVDHAVHGVEHRILVSMWWSRPRREVRPPREVFGGWWGFPHPGGWGWPAEVGGWPHGSGRSGVIAFRHDPFVAGVDAGWTVRPGG